MVAGEHRHRRHARGRHGPRRVLAGSLTGGSTPATRTLEHLGLPFETHTYAHDPAAGSYGLEAAEATGVPPEQIFKTLLVDTGTGLAVGVVPVS